ncbi:MAG: RNA polymerase sigma factor [Candidatus Paceibacterota bacterium]|jgi:RNA polymerase sigma-70 factor (ECF subfamily)
MTTEKEMQLNKEFTTAHHDYNKSLNSYAFFKLQDSTVGEDAVQDTFMKTWKYLLKGGKINIMKAFLYHILNNLIVDVYRKRKNKMISLDTLIKEKDFEPGSNDSERLINFLDGKKVISLIKQLPETYEKVIRMRYIQDLSLKEISILTGKTMNAVAVQIHRGLEKIKVLHKKELLFTNQTI